jgi:hypothetical protein
MKIRNKFEPQNSKPAQASDWNLEFRICFGFLSAIVLLTTADRISNFELVRA